MEFDVQGDAVHIRVNRPKPRLTRAEAHPRVQSVLGSATNKSMTTDEIMRMFRGDDWGRE